MGLKTRATLFQGGGGGRGFKTPPLFQGGGGEGLKPPPFQGGGGLDAPPLKGGGERGLRPPSQFFDFKDNSSSDKKLSE